MRLKYASRFILTSALLGSPALHAALLFDPAAGQLPENYTPNPWGYGQLVSTGSPVKTVAGGMLAFDTTSGVMRAGWSTSPGTMDRSVGFTVSLDLKVLAESHSSSDRAGFSLIALSSDLLGVEIGFWDSEIWAQNTGFTHGEGSAFNTTTASVTYDLTIQGAAYTLKADGSQILTGSLRDYSATGFPYDVPNLIFIGDDTFSAQADVELGQITFAPVPEPEEWAGLGGAGLLTFALVRRMRQLRRMTPRHANGPA